MNLSLASSKNDRHIPDATNRRHFNTLRQSPQQTQIHSNREPFSFVTHSYTFRDNCRWRDDPPNLSCISSLLSFPTSSSAIRAASSVQPSYAFNKDPNEGNDSATAVAFAALIPGMHWSIRSHNTSASLSLSPTFKTRMRGITPNSFRGGLSNQTSLFPLISAIANRMQQLHRPIGNRCIAFARKAVDVTVPTSKRSRRPTVAAECTAASKNPS